MANNLLTTGVRDIIIVARTKAISGHFIHIKWMEGQLVGLLVCCNCHHPFTKYKDKYELMLKCSEK